MPESIAPERPPLLVQATTPSRRLVLLPLGFTALLMAFTALPRLRENARLLGSFAGACALLLVWAAALFARAVARNQSFRAHFVLRRPHWLQPLVQGSIYLYWGWEWEQVSRSAYLIAAQLVFAYAFDLLLAWTRDQDYELGLGPFPIVLSINLFLWFRPDWFWWQFVLIATGFGAKQLLRWKKDGRSTHIFNPSSFPLAIASVLLLATGTGDHTFGAQIAATLENPRHIFEFLFLVSIPGQVLFGVASMTMPAVLTAFLLGAVYQTITGTYYFFSTIPTAVFLGMLLLFTDPATAPRTELGRVLYGILYGASAFILFGVLELLDQQGFYDKLLLVPLLNLSVQGIDRIATSRRLAWLDPSVRFKRFSGRPRNLVWTGVWAGGFALLLALHAVGDTHPGNRVPYWEKACAQGLRNGCLHLLSMETIYCDRGSGWACNEVGIRASMGKFLPDHLVSVRTTLFQRACKLGFQSGCANERLQVNGGELRRAPPTAADYELLLENKNLPSRHTPAQLWTWACEQGWAEACDGGGPAPSQPIQEDVAACGRGERAACRAVAVKYRRGDGVARDDHRALACELGIKEICLARLQ